MNLLNKIKNLFFDFRYGLVTLIIFIVASTYTYTVLDEVVDKNINREYSTKIGELIREVNYQIDNYSNTIRGIYGLYSASDDVEREEWESYIQNTGIKETFPAIRVYEYIERVKPEDIDTFISDVRSEGYTDFDVSPRDENQDYYVVNYIEPLETNRGAFGLNLSTNKERSEAVYYARDTKSFSITAPIELVQENDILAYIHMLAVYDNDLPNSSLTERRNSIQGLVAAAIVYDEIFNSVNDRVTGLSDIYIRVSDEEKVVYQNTDKIEGLDKEEIRGLHATNYINIGGRKWKIETYPTSNFMESFSAEASLPKLILIGGILFGVILFILFFVLSTSQRRAEVIAKKMTERFEREQEKVKEQNEKLKENIKEIEKKKKDSDKQKAELEKLNKLMIGREMTMIELKKEMRALREEKDEA